VRGGADLQLWWGRIGAGWSGSAVVVVERGERGEADLRWWRGVEQRDEANLRQCRGGKETGARRCGPE
jgi:hypothetical protein